MPTHEYWQYAFVRDNPTGTTPLPRLGHTAPLIVETSNMPKGSTVDNQPVGRTASDLSPVGATTSGDHIRVYWAYPEDFGSYTLTGAVKILKKTKEFPRGYNDAQANEVLNLPASAPITPNEYSVIADNDLKTNDTIWYYTVFYEVYDGSDYLWAYSPINGHDRGFALRADQETYGNLLYNYFPRAIRLKDATEGNDSLKRLCKIIGRAFDEASDRLSLFEKTRHLPDRVDAALIPYIDQLFGWPTNFELSEKLRRDETGNILDLWRAKGTTNALELALQETLGWDVDFYYGHRYTLTTATYVDGLDLTSEPAGWNEATDGVWADLVDGLVFNGTMTAAHTYSPDSPNATIRTIYSNVGWHNTYGLLIDLVEPVVASALSSALARDKVKRLLPYLAMHYVKSNIRVVENYSETLSLNTSDEVTDTTSPS